eukprot:TRINITY_DN1925_c0_g1_i1.p1 TRINITY_DN1925_c0_g1~~TRINITY_DN1925_c0_g1_i1.p1  ORF type:complete len:554 (-),score=103.88 TRINITY_DN1925_c0_g1_i1:719-2380(-)
MYYEQYRSRSITTRLFNYLWNLPRRRRERLIWILILGAVCVLLVFSRRVLFQPRERQRGNYGADGVLNVVDGNQLRQFLKFLSYDSLEGRGTGTRGEKLATQYIDNQFSLFGLRTFFQQVPLVGLTPHEETSITFESQGKEVSLKLIEEFVISTDHTADRMRSSEELIFIGFGISAPEYDWDDYKDVDIAGKLVLCLVNEPADDPALFKGEELTYYGRWMYKLDEVRRRKAKGIILIHMDQSAGYPFTVISNQVEQVQFDHSPSADLEMRAWITEPAANKVLSLVGYRLEGLIDEAASREFRPFTMEIQCVANMNFGVRQFQGTNVVGLLQGTTRPDEYVIYAAHHDHLGNLSPQSDGDTVYNGAEDNASGLSLMLGVAKSFASAGPPAKSIIFLSLTAEEYGLLGALYYTANPIFPLKKSLLCVNFDIANLYGKTRDIVGLGAEASGLADFFARAASAEGLYVSQDLNPGSGTLLRSDTLAFMNAGIPSIYIFSGRDFVDRSADYYKQQRQEFVEERYHRVGDDYDENWSMDGLLQQLRVAIRLGYSTINAE